MTWTKLGAEFPDEVSTLSDAAFRTHVEALCWSNRRLLDLVIPKGQLRKFAETDEPDAAVAELVAAGWWRDDGATWYVGVHFADWQRDRVQVEHLRQRNTRNQQRKRRHDLDDHSLCLPGRCKALSSGDSAGDTPDDSRGDPERNGTEQTGRREERSDDQVCDDFLKGRRPDNWPAALPHSSETAGPSGGTDATVTPLRFASTTSAEADRVWERGYDS